MSDAVFVKTYAAPPIDEREILRYAGCGGQADEKISVLLQETLAETEKGFSYRVCYREITLTDFYGYCLEAKTSKDLRAHLHGCEKAVLFCATVGLDIDRKILGYGAVSPAKGVLAQAIGAERIESLCNAFYRDLQKEYPQNSLTDRYSAGYGDFPLTAQRGIFALLNCAKRIGVTLTESLLMSPTKSVSAIIGIKRERTEENSACKKNCAACGKEDCIFRING